MKENFDGERILKFKGFKEIDNGDRMNIRVKCWCVRERIDHRALEDFNKLNNQKEVDASTAIQEIEQMTPQVGQIANCAFW